MSMKQNTQETLLARWIEGDITPAEADLLAEMDGIQDLKDALHVYEGMSLTPMNLDEAWSKLAQKTVLQPKTIKTKHRSLFPTILRVAAAVALIVGVGFWYASYFLNADFTADAGQTALVTLPDGSAVTLNSGSKLSYSKWQWKRHRIVQLTGEAFFKVQKGEKFTVQSPHGQTSVLGTQFDVFDRGETFQVKCFEGRVKVSDRQQTKVITKGQGIKISAQGIKDLDVSASKPAWFDGQTKFFENSLQEVFEELQRQYILEIDSDNVDLSRQFTGVLPNNNLDKALNYLCDAMNLTYQKTNDNRLIKISSKK
ncbi:MAG TPA: DUF4974 domain-containing protein [Saprospiraceae bacterium]|nr:DUF4974 domain-containing protein [Saprospiraceae bacterium]